MVRSALTHCSSMRTLCCWCQQDDHLCHITESHSKAWILKTVWCSISREYCLTKCSAQGQGAGSGVRKGWCHCPGNTSESLLTWIFNLQHIIQSDTTLLPMTYFDVKGELWVQHLALSAPLVSLHAGWHNSAASVSLPPKNPQLVSVGSQRQRKHDLCLLRYFTSCEDSLGEKSKCEASDNKVHLVVLFRSHYGQQGLQDFTSLASVTFRFKGKYIWKWKEIPCCC